MTDLRIGRDRVRLYGIGLALIGLSQLRFVSSVGHYWDWVGFYSAGSLAGTRSLLDAQAYHAWGVAHGLSVLGFPYLPGFAWILAPAANLSLAWGFALNAVLMAALVIVAARLAARIYSLDAKLTTYMTIGWAPVTAAIVTGQNSPLGLVLSLFAIDGVARDDALSAGLSFGALCYKPTYALPFGLLLLMYKKWKAITILLACAATWYVISALAAGGDWQWPASYVRMLGELMGPDYRSNGPKAVSVPGVLILLGASPRIALAVAVAGLLGGLALLKARQVSAFKAASLTGAICIATSVHAWAYDAAIALPAVFWVAAKGEEPWRTRGIVLAYAIAPLWLASHALGFDPFAIVVIVGTAGLLVAAANSEGEKGLGPKLPKAETAEGQKLPIPDEA